MPAPVPASSLGPTANATSAQPVSREAVEITHLQEEERQRVVRALLLNPLLLAEVPDHREAFS